MLSREIYRRLKPSRVRRYSAVLNAALIQMQVALVAWEFFGVARIGVPQLASALQELWSRTGQGFIGKFTKI